MRESRSRGRRPARALRRGALGLIIALAACSAPDDSVLYRPFGPGSGGSDLDASVPSMGGGATDASAAGGSSGEGQGGSSLDGGGTGGSDVGGGAGVTDGGIDSGSTPDAAPPCEPSTEVCDGIDNDCDGEVDPDGTCDEDCAGFALEGRGYMYCADAVQRSNAEDGCEDVGMHLAWLETPEESEALRDEIVATGLPAPQGNAELLTQIGGRDSDDDGEWFWVGNGTVTGGFQFWQGDDGGEAVDGAYAEWASGEPSEMLNEDCAAMSVLGSPMRAAGEWDDRNCNQDLPYVCEVP